MTIYNRDMCESLPRFDRSVSLLCWAYNEELLIAEYLRRIDALLKKHVVEYEIVVIDDGSTDGTADLVERMKGEIPAIRLIRNDRNRNVGYSCKRAILSARKEYLFWQTIDWSYDISYLRIFLELLKTCDIVAGVRREPVRAVDETLKPLLGLMNLFGVKHITRRSDTVGKAVVSVINYILIRCLFGVPLSDYQNVVFYRTRLLQGIALEADSSFLNPEGLIKSYWRGASIVEVPISFLPRRQGVAKGTRFKAIARSISDIVFFWFTWIILGKRGKINKGNVRRLKPDEWLPVEGRNQ